MKVALLSLRSISKVSKGADAFCDGRSNNSLNPTRLSMPFIKVVALRLDCVVSSAVGLIRALGGFAIVI